MNPNFGNVSETKTETFKTRNLLSPKVGVWVVKDLQVFPNDFVPNGHRFFLEEAKWLQWKSPNVTLHMDLLLQYFLQDPRPAGNRKREKKTPGPSGIDTESVMVFVCVCDYHHHHHHHHQMMMIIIT